MVYITLYWKERRYNLSDHLILFPFADIYIELHLIGNATNESEMQN